jgi:hypothetical protein
LVAGVVVGIAFVSFRIASLSFLTVRRASQLYVLPATPTTTFGPAVGRPRASPFRMGEAAAAEAAGALAWSIAQSGLLPTPSWTDGVGDVVAATSPALASLGTEVPLEFLLPPREQDMSYDWRMNHRDWRFGVFSCVPFGLLLIAISLQRTERGDTPEEEEECDISLALAGLVPLENLYLLCGPTAGNEKRPTVSMAAVAGTQGLHMHDCEA